MIHVRVNHGRWIADCPCCHGAELAANLGDTFRCSECGYGPVELVWPPHRHEIEGLLRQRPLRNRNWDWSEPLNLLRAENHLHVHELLPER